MNASSLARCSNTSSSAERFMRIVSAFFAICYVIENSQTSSGNASADQDIYCIITSQKLQVAHWQKLMALEKVRLCCRETNEILAC